MTTSDTVSGCTKAELANSKRISNESSLTQSNQFDSVLLLQKSRFIKSDLKFGSVRKTSLKVRRFHCIYRYDKSKMFN